MSVLILMSVQHRVEVLSMYNIILLLLSTITIIFFFANYSVSILRLPIGNEVREKRCGIIRAYQINELTQTNR